MFIRRLQYLLWLVAVGASQDDRARREYFREIHLAAAYLVAFWVMTLIAAILSQFGTTPSGPNDGYLFALVRLAIGFPVAAVVIALLQHHSLAWDVQELSARHVLSPTRLKWCVNLVGPLLVVSAGVSGAVKVY